MLAKAVGKPVRVQWSRADEHGWDPKGPPTLIDLRAKLDDKGNVVAGIRILPFRKARPARSISWPQP